MDEAERIALMKQIYSLLARLSEDEFLQFCQLYYQEVYYRVFTTGMTQGQRERLLIERAERGQTLSQLPHQLQGTFFDVETETHTMTWADFPLEDVPAVAVLPLGSEMPLGVNPTFVGRQDELRELARVLHGGGTAVVGETTTSVTGAGGIGKSQLAAAFVHRYGQYFTGGVYWLNFSQSQAISSEISNCVGAVKMPRQQFEALPEPERVAQVQRAWQEPTPRLLIFDNCEDPALLAKWQPRTGGCRVLVTSRHSAWERGMGINTLPLDTLPLPESVALLQQLVPHLADSEAEQVAQAVGRFPLALYLAGGYLGRRSQLGDFLAQLEMRKIAHKAMEGHGLTYSPTGHVLSVSATFALSWGQLQADDARDERAKRLLATICQFAPDEPLPISLLQVALEDEAREQVDEGLLRLRELGLLPADVVRVHRLIVLFVQARLAEDVWHEVQEQVETAVGAELSRLNEAGYPAVVRPWLTHFTYLVGQVLTHGDERSANLANELGYHLMQDGVYIEARPYLECALQIYEEKLGMSHPYIAKTLNYLGGLLYHMGAYAEARSCYERALKIDEEKVESSYPNIAIALSNLGLLLQEMGLYEEARPYLERALQIHEEEPESNLLETATSLNNLGLLFGEIELYEEAISYYERALKIEEEKLGVSHPHTAITLNNLGLLLQDVGAYEEARPYLERALQIHEETLGANHPNTAGSLNSFGMLLEEMGLYEEAKSCYERTLKIAEEKLGTTHPHTATSLNNLGLLLRDMGAYAEAVPYVERALAIFEAQLGADHQHTKWARENLQGVLEAQAGEEE